jgi:hypothetical protein
MASGDGTVGAGVAGAGEVAGAVVGAVVGVLGDALGVLGDALGVVDGALGGGVDCGGEGDESVPCAAGAGGVSAGEVVGLVDVSGGACARTGPKAARLATNKMRETSSPRVITSFSVERRSIPRYYRHAKACARMSPRLLHCVPKIRII